MKQKAIKYIGYYDSEVNGEYQRLISPAAKNKMDYVAHLIEQSGFEIRLISLARKKKFSFIAPKLLSIPGRNVKYIYAFGGQQKLARVLDLFIQKIMLFFYLLFSMKRGEVLVVYHSLGYGRTIWLAKCIKGFRLMLEVEEIYHDVIDGTIESRKSEFMTLISADAYIFPTNLLRESIGCSSKNFIIIHGSYFCFPEIEYEFDDAFVHVVYAGTFDSRKGVLEVIEMCEFLPEKYHLHILGFGTPQEIDRVEESINIVSSRCKSRISYDGLMVGEKFSKFLSKCQIGLAYQNLNAKFNSTSFPSKILTYLAHGLKVVASDIEAVKRSSVAPFIYLLESNDPQLLARQICSIDLEDKTKDGRNALNNLNIETKIKMQSLLNSLID